MHAWKTCGYVINVKQTVTGSQSEFVWVDGQSESFRSEKHVMASQQPSTFLGAKAF